VSHPGREDRSARGDARLVARIDAAWRPEPLDDAGRTRFDARLRERLDAARPWRGARLAWAAVGLALVAGVAWSLRASDPGDAPPTVAAHEAPIGAWPSAPEAARITAWEWELLAADAVAAARDDELPDEYAAIATVFQIY
jgi:hypothetical protein